MPNEGTDADRGNKKVSFASVPQLSQRTSPPTKLKRIERLMPSVLKREAKLQ
jgi:hypothetical protein